MKGSFFSEKGLIMAIQKNAIELVAYAKSRLGSGYVFGTYGQILTEQLLSQKLAQYPRQVGRFEKVIRAQWLGKHVQDCSGLIKGFLWQGANQTANYQENGIPDFSADSMFAMAKDKGLATDIPEIPGLMVWKPGHIGVYIGNGEVIESNSTKAGVIKTKLTKTVNETRWKIWLKCPYLSYLNQIPEKGYIFHTVAKGDSLSKIAKHYLGSAAQFKEIAVLNGIYFPYVIHQNQVLKVPKK